MRRFESGATRDTDEGKLDFEGFLSPLVLERFAQYMHRHRTQRDGELRDSDNWQRGMGLRVYMKSLWRHFFATWKLHRRMIREALRERDNPLDDDLLVSIGTEELDELEDDLCAVLFNVQGYLHELMVLRDDGGF